MKSQRITWQRRSIVRRTTTLVVGLVTVGLALAGCSLAPSGGSSDNVLTVAIWKGYGADLPWVATQFKKETGATLKFQFIDSEADQLKLLQKAKGSIDVALPNIQYIGQGIDENLFQPLDKSKLSNWKNLYPALSGRTEITKGGKLYGIPWTYGSSAIFYNSNKVTPPITSLTALWDASLKGKIALEDDPTVEVPLVALAMGLDPQNPDMSKLTPEMTKLEANAKLNYLASDDLAKAIATGSVVAGIGNSDTLGGLITSHAAGTDGFKYVIPTEGAVGWIDNWTIAKGTKHLALAYKWLNYMTGVPFLTRWANAPADASPAPANSAVVDALPQATLDRIQANPDKIKDLSLQLPVPQARLQSWIDAWNQAKAAS